jgi:hypothetical protein
MDRIDRLWPMWLIAFLTTATMSIAAQEKPDFSGHWVLTSPHQSDADVPVALSVRRTLVRTTARGEPMKPFFRDITIERRFRTSTSSETRVIGVLGGTVSGRRADATSGGDTTHHSLTWEGNALVFESGSHTGRDRQTGVWTERREVWALDTDGRLRVEITTRGSDQASRAIALMYARP